ncbi:hypothetical protein, partial [Vandammella animalimorsus]|uniref:hypothetical protein n=1 Tax=Vandammella animalimorsus TaxID=2029117 RepID=UPI001EEF4E4D
AAVVALDMGLELVLVGAQLAIHRLGVEMLHPALGLMDLRALLAAQIWAKLSSLIAILQYIKNCNY